MARRLVGKCDKGHGVTVTIDDDDNVSANIGIDKIDPAPDPDFPNPEKLVVACPSCVREVGRLTGLPLD